MYFVQLILRSNLIKSFDIFFYLIILGDFVCLGGSVEIEIDGYDLRGFRFLFKGFNGFFV